MVFSSIPFLYYFLPPVIVIYFAVPRRAKNPVLLAASLIFYFYAEEAGVLLLVGSALSAYLFGRLIGHFRGRRAAKGLFVCSVLISLSGLILFKYADFILLNLNTLTGLSLPLLKLVMPVGISFYTFQILSYTIDVYRGTVKVQKNFLNFAAYVALFPQLVAGPIVRYRTVEKELTARKHTLEDAGEGAARFVYGLAKKVLIANPCGELCALCRASTEKTVLFAWLYALAFTLQIYFDFSAYSDMAIGLGRVFGFHFPENFNYPYLSRSIREFWRRWHMSLGTWFRDYVYIPLGGSRTGKARWIRNILIVWLLTGLWHGAAWNFVVWGLYFAVFLIAEKLFLSKILEKLPGFFSHLYVLLVVGVSFVIFNGSTLSEALGDLAAMFGAAHLPFAGTETCYYMRTSAVRLLTAGLGATPRFHRLNEELLKRDRTAGALTVLEPLLLAALLFLVTACLVDGSFNPFLYFRF